MDLIEMKRQTSQKDKEDMAQKEKTEKKDMIETPPVAELPPARDAAAQADSPYSRFSADVLILRDELAIDRTLLANERTLLAYLRSAVALILAGFTMIHFAAESEWFWLAGFVSIPIGILAGAVGILRFNNMNRMITRIRRQIKEETEEAEKMVTG